MSCDVAAEAATNKVDFCQRLRVEEALEGATERIDVVKRRRLAANDVVSFGAQRAQLPKSAVLAADWQTSRAASLAPEEVRARATRRPQEHNSILSPGTAAVIPPFLQHAAHYTLPPPISLACAPARSRPPTRRTSRQRTLP